jgi:hypothetical protein
MKSALGLILGVSILATAVGSAGCDNGDSEASGGSGPIMIGAGTTGTSAGAGTVQPTAGSSTGGAATLGEGVPLDPMNGWVDAAGNSLMIQGAMFPFGDPTSLMGSMPVDFSASGADACFKGTAAKVDVTATACATKMFTPPAMDCYGEFWGAAIGLNLNQKIDEASGLGGTPAPFNASAITGFTFEISGAMVPAPKDLRFKVEDASGEYCNVAAKQVKAGANSFVFADLVKECWKPPVPPTTAEGAKAGLVKIAWQVVTNDKGTVPFDFCVKNLRALQ